VILLVDMDAFFASVEQAHHPHLRGVPVIVCGDPSRRGVVTAASYEARPFGVRAGMPLGEARRLCPQAQYVEGNPDKYVALSVKLLDLYLTISPDVEPFSVDEAFIQLARRDSLEQAREVAAKLQSEIDRRFSLGASIGIGPSKLVAKMASGVQKPRGLTALDVPAFQQHFWPLDVQELWGVGPKLAARMRSLGITTVGELAHASADLLKGHFGIIGPQLREAASGHDDTPLVPCHKSVDPKSMGHEVTLPEDSRSIPFLEGTLLRLSDQVARRLRTDRMAGRVVTVKLRSHRFETVMRQRALSEHTRESRRVFEVARTLWRENWDGGPLRLVGVTVSDLKPVEGGDQTELFEVDHRSRTLIEALDRVRDRLGEASIVPAGSIAHIGGPASHVPFGTVPTASAPGDRPVSRRSGAPPDRPAERDRRSPGRPA
jgi:DNA polymerase-4